MSSSFGVQSFGIYSEYNGAFALPSVTAAMKQIAAAGANTVELVPVIFTGTRTSSTVFASPTKTDSDANLRKAFADAAATGLGVILKPHLAGLDGTGAQALAPANLAGFFASYKAEMVHLATLAQQAGVKTFSVGNELSGLTGSATLPYWTDLIASVRKVYTGSLTYASAMNEASQVSFWSQLDKVGVNAYPPLTSKGTPTEGELIRAWTSVPSNAYWAGAFNGKSPLDFLQSLSSTYGKQVLLTEVGYRSIVGTAIDPGVWESAGTPSDAAQATAYSAFAHVFATANGSWLQGMSFWQWDASNRHSPTGYSPMGKPAQAVVQQLFEGRIAPTNQTVGGSPGNDTIALGAGNDTIKAGLGNDIITGGAGNDVIVGGPDTIARNATTTVTVTGFGSGGAVMQLWVNGAKVGADATFKTAVDASGYQTHSFTFTNPANVKSLDIALMNAGVGVGLFVKNVTVNGQALQASQATNSSSLEPFDLYVRTIHFDTTGMQPLFTGSATDNDTMYGGAGNDRMSGGAGNDVFVGGAGNDTADGGSGTNTAVFSGKRVDYRVRGSGSAATVADTVANRDGTDTLTSIQALRFADVTVNAATLRNAVTAVHDFNGDGIGDLLWRKANGQLSTGLATGAGNFSTAALGSAPADSTVKAAADVSGDGRADVVWQNRDGSVALRTTTDTSFRDTSLGTMKTGWTLETAADYTGDGKADLLWQHDNGTVLVMASNGSSTAGTANGNVGAGWHIQPFAGDFNGDGKADILLRSDDNFLKIWTSTGSGFQSKEIGALKSDWKIKGTGDFDGDGRSDILCENSKGTALIWHSTITGFSGINSGSATPGYDVKAIDDVTGDGKADIIWSTAKGETMLWKSNGATSFTSSPIASHQSDWRVLI